jgi:hypothetical protein
MSVIGQDLSFLQEQMRPDQDVVSYKSAQQFRFNAFRKETQDITITTEEGDTVTISSLSKFQADYMAFDYTALVKGESTSFQAEKFKASSENAFKITVEGDLNEEEQEDIDKVLKKLDSIMNDLVSGNLDGLMNRALGIIDDTETISGLNAVLQFQQRVSMEQRSMTQLSSRGQQMPPPPEGKILSASNLIAEITDQLLKFIEESEVDASQLKEPVNGYFSQLLEKISGEHGGDNPLTQMIDQLSAELLNRLDG